MKSPIQEFTAAIRNRSAENRIALKGMSQQKIPASPAFSILRQELDSMVRVIYLLSLLPSARDQLIKDTLSGSRWETETPKGKKRKVTDKEMIKIAQDLEGWTLSVYRFGCAFIHLSDFHNHLSRDPFQSLSREERKDVLTHMRNYHGGPVSDNPSIDDILYYIPMIFEKISSNLECYLVNLEEAEQGDGSNE